MDHNFITTKRTYEKSTQTELYWLNCSQNQSSSKEKKKGKHSPYKRKRQTINALDTT